MKKLPKLTTLIGLEISKMFHKKRIVFGLAIIIGLYLIMTFSISRYSGTPYHEGPWYRENLEYELQYYRDELNNPDITAEAKEHFQQRIKDIEYELEVGYLTARKVFLQRELDQINEILKEENLSDENRRSLLRSKELLEAQMEYGENSPEVQKLLYEERLERINEGLSRDNSPEQEAKLLSEKKQLELQIKQTQSENEYNAFYMLTMFFSTVGSFFLPLVIILVASEAISGEYSLGTIKLLLIKPFSRAKLFISKYIALLIYGLFVFATTATVGYLLGGLFVGFGGAGLTRVVGQTYSGNGYNFFVDYRNAFLISNFNYLLLILGLFLVLLTMVVAFSMLISVFTKSATISLVASLGLLIFGNILSTLISRFAWTKYTIFPHVNILNHLEGRFGYEGVTLSFSVVTILVYTVITLILGIVSFRKKDIV